MTSREVSFPAPSAWVAAWLLLLGPFVLHTFAAEGWSLEEAVRKMTVAQGLEITQFAAEPDVRQPIFVKCDDRGRLWTIQYLQYPNPAGLQRKQVDRWSRTVYDRIPEPPPKGPIGADRITICEDTNGDGRADTFKDFVGGLNLCTALEFGYGGVFVLQAPYLLFYPDENRDDVPDSDPHVLLTGFGMEDAQSLANHLTWGPDGWLYGLNGSTTTCKIRGTEFQQGVWRYHPRTQEFELFCEGGGNVFGLTFDEVGRLFYSSNLGLFWHAHQGAYYQKNLGKHGPLHNPYAYGWLSHVAHNAPTGGPTTGGTIYRGDTFPERFRGRFLAGDFLRHTASCWELRPGGATVSAQFQELLCDSHDAWFGATDLCLGSDGAVYVSDFHDKRTAHPDPDADWDRSNGRIYKIQAADAARQESIDLAKLSTAELVKLLKHANGWYADRARVLLAQRQDPAVWPELREMSQHENTYVALQGLWSLHASGGLDPRDEALMGKLTRHPSEHVRAWTIRLLGDRKLVSSYVAQQFARVAATDPSTVVRAQLLCTAKRLSGEQALPLIEQTLLRDADTDDPILPWLLWWAIESKATSDHEFLTDFFTDPKHRTRPAVKANYGRLVRRYAAEGSNVGYDAAHALLTALSSAEQAVLLTDLDKGLSERAVGLAPVGQGDLFESLAVNDRHVPQPKSFAPLTSDLVTFIAERWKAAPTSATRTRLALRADIADALRRVHADIADAQSSRELLMERLVILEEFGTQESARMILPLLSSGDPEVQVRALSILGRFGGPEADRHILNAYPKLLKPAQAKSRQVLFSRREWAQAFLELVEMRSIAPAEVPLEDVRLLALLEDQEIDAAVRKHWGNLKPGSSEEKLAEMRRFSNDLRAGSGDVARGKLLFNKHCATCHKLFGEGAVIGPDLTTTSRADITTLLNSIVDPSAVIRSQYIQAAVDTTEGVVHSGLIADQDEASLTLVNAKGEKHRIPRNQIDSVRDLPTSIMPEKLLEPLTPQERRDLFAYLQTTGK